MYQFKSDYAEGDILIGMNYKGFGYTDSAKLYYKSALIIHNYRIENYSENREKLYSKKINNAFVLALLGILLILNSSSSN